MQLKPCPFCGGEARTDYVRDGRRAYCPNCSSCGPPAFHGRPDQLSAEYRAIEAWNRRAVEDEYATLEGKGPR